MCTYVGSPAWRHVARTIFILCVSVWNPMQTVPHLPYWKIWTVPLFVVLEPNRRIPLAEMYHQIVHIIIKMHVYSKVESHTHITNWWVQKTLHRSNLQSSRFEWPKGRVCFAVISGTFHAINIPARWKLSASVSTAGVDTTSRKKRTCQCTHVKYSTERRQVGKAGLICKKSNIAFSGIWNSAFCVMFWRILRLLLLLFWNSLIKVYLYTWKVKNACPRAYVFKLF